MQRGRLHSAVRTLHVGADRETRGRRGRIPCVTSCPPSAPSSPSARPRLHTALAISAIIVATIIYLRSEAKQVCFGGKRVTVHRTRSANNGVAQNRRLKINTEEFAQVANDALIALSCWGRVSFSQEVLCYCHRYSALPTEALD